MDTWQSITETLAANAGKAFADVGTAAAAVRKVQTELTLDSFTQAAVATSRIQTSKEIAFVSTFFKECQLLGFRVWRATAVSVGSR